ncbi:UNVERIFIED_ORG: hypothetical protein J2X79_000561 [Arthrobacter globiformis]|nr:hypothetical protein [Arthrobacter globiformis]
MTISTKAHAHIPGFNDHTQAEKRINDEIARNRAIKFEPTISANDFVDAALAGADFPEEPHFHNEKIRAARLNAGARAQMLKDALKSVQERKRDLIRDNSASALGYLRGELAALMDEVRSTHGTLGNVRTAEAVLAANDPDIASAWRASGELVSRYVEMRSLQHAFTAPGLGDGQKFQIAAVGHIRNSLELSDYWLSKRAKSSSHRAANDPLSGVRNFDEWLVSGGTAPFKHSIAAIPSTDSNGNPVNAWEYLVWLATEAEPWVPSVADLVAAFDAANLAVAATDYASFRTQEAGRDKYFEVVGVPPLVEYSNGPSDEKTERKARRASGARAMGL